MFKKLLLSLLIIGGTAVGVAYYKINQLGNHPLTMPKDQFLVVEKGTSSQKLANLLTSQGIIDSADSFLLPYLIRFHPEFNQFKAGVYALNEVQDVKGLLQHLNSGKEVQLNVQLIEGKTFKAWREQLAKAKYLKQTLKEKNEAEIATLLGIPQGKVEGWLAPDTYRYAPYSSDLDLLKRAYQKQQKDLDSAWQNRAENLPLANPYEMLILASIVEKETALAKERPQVASVFINRLKIKMPLQTDPTVIYGMGERYQGNITKKDLQEATPYNTYVINGLPPTPIAMPSLASLQGVAKPDETPYLYFVADGSGGHKFSKTYAEHQQGVQQWIKIERERNKAKSTTP
ncbi:aminodeoxychorismate lyase [Pasteurellaceae bacterium Macca]|nr:aminodeoxychorismate lyase [Pasteurellaceae bacterium Macca]